MGEDAAKEVAAEEDIVKEAAKNVTSKEDVIV